MLLTQRNATGTVQIAQLPLHLGGELHDVRIAYTLHGDSGLPVVAALGGISAGRHVTAADKAGWWQDFVGIGKAIDTREFAVLGIDFLGGSGATTGPRNAPFPAISTFDQARVLEAILDHLGIEQLHSFVGSSYGGMVALVFGARYARRVRKLIVISAAHQPHPMATALRSLQRRTIRLGIETGRVADAVSIARGIAMTTYRTTTEFAQRFDASAHKTTDGFGFPVEEYLQHCGVAYARSFSPWGFLCLSESIDLHDVDPHEINVPTTLVSVDSDTLVPVWQMRALAHAIGNHATLVGIQSIYGHDAFLKEVHAVSAALRTALHEGAIS